MRHGTLAYDGTGKKSDILVGHNPALNELYRIYNVLSDEVVHNQLY